jgi:hypothetical protein
MFALACGKINAQCNRLQLQGRGGAKIVTQGSRAIVGIELAQKEVRGESDSDSHAARVDVQASRSLKKQAINK